MKIAGISRGHNASVCLINDGEIEFYIEEERLTRSKYDGAPFKGLLLSPSSEFLSLSEFPYLPYLERLLRGRDQSLSLPEPRFLQLFSDIFKLFEKTTLSCLDINFLTIININQNIFKPFQNYYKKNI